MTTVVELTLAPEDFSLGQILNTETETDVELLEVVPTDDSVAPYFRATGEELDAFESAVREDDRADSLDCLDCTGDRRLYHLEWSDGDDWFFDALDDTGLVLVAGEGSSRQWWFQCWADDRETVSALYDAARATGASVDIERIADETESRSPAYDLTEKQREAILLALEQGYFDVPRETSLTNIGEELDISHQSVSRRLNRGLRALVENTLAHDVHREH